MLPLSRDLPPPSSPAPACEADRLLPKTRIGAFDFYVGTCTEPLWCGSADVQRACGDSWRGVTEDLFLFSQEDPLGMVDGVGLYRYVRMSPMAFNDPTGTASSCVFLQNTGHLVCHDTETGSYMFDVEAYSGKNEGRNNAASQSQEGIGPLPAGLYTMRRHWRNIAGSEPDTIGLVPYPGANSYGRGGGFAIHTCMGLTSEPAKSSNCSQGCVVVLSSEAIREIIERGAKFGSRTTVEGRELDWYFGTLTVVPGPRKGVPRDPFAPVMPPAAPGRDPFVSLTDQVRR